MRVRAVQLTFGGGSAASRAGCIGKVQRLLDERPWLSACEIAKAVEEPTSRVSNALNGLKQEGRAVFEEALGPRDGYVWASPTSGHEGLGAEHLATLRAQKADREAQRDAKMAEQAGAKLAKRLAKMGITAESPDWRGPPMGEHYYAL